MIRQLRPGEAVPPFEPRRYCSDQGYIRLRWKVGVRSYVETYEHRVKDGVVVADEHVHHANHQRQDNRPENLEGLTAAEHGRRHRSTDRAAVVALYAEGRSMPEVARLLGINQGNVSRILRDEGVPARRKRDYHADVPLAEAYSRCASAREIGERLGLTVPTVYRLMREQGLPPYRPGRR